MSRPHLFEYAVIYHPKPTKDQVERAEVPKSEMAVELTAILAMDEKQVGILAARNIPEKYADKIEDLEICIRPF